MKHQCESCVFRTMLRNDNDRITEAYLRAEQKNKRLEKLIKWVIHQSSPSFWTLDDLESFDEWWEAVKKHLIESGEISNE